MFAVSGLRRPCRSLFTRYGTAYQLKLARCTATAREMSRRTVGRGTAAVACRVWLSLDGRKALAVSKVSSPADGFPRRGR
jgi:hypothetical protein